MYYKLVITETGRNHLKESPRIFNEIIEKFENIQDAKDFIIERYDGKMPKGKNKIYCDTKKGITNEVGFLHSFWNYDISHNSHKWFQTDWICLTEVTEKPVLIK